jgi:tRNA pseudouridine55 synthase
LIIDKPLGVTSADVVHKLRRALGIRKIGHAGTLDPLASGVLPLALGEATKCIAHMMDGKKRYRFQVRFGTQTSTDDAEGPVIASSNLQPTAQSISDILPEFIGEIMQTPPIFSAIKVAGKRAYDLARRGEEFELQPRPIMVHELVFEGFIADGLAEFSALVGKGTYIRSLARDMALALGSCGHVAFLRRESVGKFTLSGAILLDFFEKDRHNPDALSITDKLHPLIMGLEGISAHELTDAQWHDIRHGRSIASTMPATDKVALIWQGELHALACADGENLKPKRVLNY